MKIVNGEGVPDKLKDKVVISLNITAMLSGTKFRGDFEERLIGVMKDVEQARDKVIIFIDEVHNIVNAGGAEGAVDASNLLKPYLARGKLRCMGATTTDEYTKKIEKDAALARRFQAIYVEEPSEADTEEILQGVKDDYIGFHGVNISDPVISAAVKLSGRYMTSRKFPDKALDLIDDACSRARHKFDLNKSSEKTEDNNDLSQLFLEENDIAEVLSDYTGIPVSSILGEREKERLLNMEIELGKSIKGQEEVLRSISQCIRRSRSGLSFHDRPLGAFLLVGSSGVGKTELAKALSEFLFGERTALLRIDMSEYMESFATTRLIGSPPGYVAHEEGGVLTNAVHKRPYQVILLDEFEKAHREVSNLLLQVMDEGRLTDSHGTVVDFRNTVIILTSNLGSHRLQENDELKRREILLSAVNNHFAPEFINRLDEVIVFSPLSDEVMQTICKLEINRVVKLMEEKGIHLSIADGVDTELIKLEYANDLLSIDDDSADDESSGNKKENYRNRINAFGARPLKRYIIHSIISPCSNFVLQVFYFIIFLPKKLIDLFMFNKIL